MKSNFRFIMPRLIGATVLVGLASLILVTIFKLMMGVLLLAGIVAMFRSFSGRSRRDYAGSRFAHFSNGGISPLSGENQWSERVSVHYAPVRNQTIVPIN